ncbi:PREDICTED: uncharacterized protein LOC104595433 [Nelumbo nucifera]|uniref:Flotillin-like n=1 Tax=Nelumbo nucifera TaxID=4432 RepID=A0A1U7ZZ12_NELNU|nr:PREDICTED: uncharacterized protein LOC104595433 [Nelumbo nucifera]
MGPSGAILHCLRHLSGKLHVRSTGYERRKAPLRSPGSVHYRPLSRRTDEYFSYLDQKTQMKAANQAKIDVAEAKMKGEIGAKLLEGKTLQNEAEIDVETRIISTQRQGEGKKEEIKVKTDVSIYENQKEADVAGVRISCTWFRVPTRQPKSGGRLHGYTLQSFPSLGNRSWYSEDHFLLFDHSLWHQTTLTKITL